MASSRGLLRSAKGTVCEGVRGWPAGEWGCVARAPLISCVDASRDGAPAGMERLAAWAAAFRSTRASPNAWCGSAPREHTRARRGAGRAPQQGRSRAVGVTRARRARHVRGSLTRMLGRQRSGTKDLEEVKAMCVPIRDDYFECLHHKKEVRTRASAPRASPSLTRAAACPPSSATVRARSADHRAGQREGGSPPLVRRARFHKRASIGAAVVDQWGLAPPGRAEAHDPKKGGSKLMKKGRIS